MLKATCKKPTCRKMIFHILGKSAHGTNPEKGIDALYTACEVIHALYAPHFTDVFVDDFSSGTAHNVVAQESRLTIRVEAADPARLSAVCSAVVHTAQEICLSCGAVLETEEAEGQEVSDT